MARLNSDEKRSFRALYATIVGKDLTDEEIAAMRNPEDPPDFGFVYSGKSIAVEHTKVFRLVGKTTLLPLHDVAIQRRICDHLQLLLERRGPESRHVDISVTFASCHMVHRNDEQAIAQGILNLVEKRIGSGDALPMTFYKSGLRGISACLGHLLVTDGGKSSTASPHAFGRVDEWGLPEFEQAAAEKAVDLLRYKGRFDQCWLLLSAGGPHRAQWFEPSFFACAAGIRTEFNRVFVVDHDRSAPRVFEISVRA